MSIASEENMLMSFENMFQSSAPGSPEVKTCGQSHRFLIFSPFILVETTVLEKFQTNMTFSKINLFFLMTKIAFGLILFFFRSKHSTPYQ